MLSGFRVHPGPLGCPFCGAVLERKPHRVKGTGVTQTSDPQMAGAAKAPVPLQHGLTPSALIAVLRLPSALIPDSDYQSPSGLSV